MPTLSATPEFTPFGEFMISPIHCVVKSHTPNDPHSSGPPRINTCHILTCHIPLCLVSRAYVTDTTSYLRGFAWTLLDRACGHALLKIVDT